MQPPRVDYAQPSVRCRSSSRTFAVDRRGRLAFAGFLYQWDGARPSIVWFTTPPSELLITPPLSVLSLVGTGGFNCVLGVAASGRLKRRPTEAEARGGRGKVIQAAGLAPSARRGQPFPCLWQMGSGMYSIHRYPLQAAPLPAQGPEQKAARPREEGLKGRRRGKEGYHAEWTRFISSGQCTLSQRP